MAQIQPGELLKPVSYDRIFDERGAKYHDAMSLFPKARDNEFLRAFDQVERSAVTSVLDIPSGGSYLQGFFENATLSAIDFTAAFANKTNSVEVVDIDRFELTANCYDLAISMAAIHHIENKKPFSHKVFNAVKPNGYYCIADVPAESAIARFLDDYVGQYNGTGHEGMFISERLGDNLDWLPEGKVVEHQVKSCPWIFAKQADLILFAKTLFCISGVSDEDLLDKLEQYVGITGLAGEACQVDWELLYILLQK